MSKVTPLSRTVALPGGRRVCLHEAGEPDGDPLVWLHGGLSSSVEVAFLDGAARRHAKRVIGLDRPGIGHSSFSGAPSVAEWGLTVLDCADQLGLESFAVAGWSAGGAYALACGHLFPDRLTSLTTVAGMHTVSETARHLELGLLADQALLSLAEHQPSAAKAVLVPFAHLPEPVLWALIRFASGAAERRALTADARPLVVDMLHHAVLGGTAGVVEDYRRCANHWGFKLNEVGVPVTVLQGDTDGLVPPHHGELLAADLPQASLRMLERASHYLPLTHPDTIMESVS